MMRKSLVALGGGVQSVDAWLRSGEARKYGLIMIAITILSSYLGNWLTTGTFGFPWSRVPVPVPPVREPACFVLVDPEIGEVQLVALALLAIGLVCARFRRDKLGESFIGASVAASTLAMSLSAREWSRKMYVGGFQQSPNNCEQFNSNEQAPDASPYFIEAAQRLEWERMSGITIVCAASLLVLSATRDYARSVSSNDRGEGPVTRPRRLAVASAALAVCVILLLFAVVLALFSAYLLFGQGDVIRALNPEDPPQPPLMWPLLVFVALGFAVAIPLHGVRRLGIAAIAISATWASTNYFVVRREILLLTARYEIDRQEGIDISMKPLQLTPEEEAEIEVLLEVAAFYSASMVSLFYLAILAIVSYLSFRSARFFLFSLSLPGQMDAPSLPHTGSADPVDDAGPDNDGTVAEDRPATD